MTSPAMSRPAKPRIPGLGYRSIGAAVVATTANDTVLMTHMHPEYFNALADTAGTALFPQSRGQAARSGTSLLDQRHQ